MEDKKPDQETVVHSLCKNSFHAHCFDEWSNDRRSRGHNVTYATFRVVLVEAEDDAEGDWDEDAHTDHDHELYTELWTSIDSESDTDGDPLVSKRNWVGHRDQASESRAGWIQESKSPDRLS